MLDRLHISLTCGVELVALHLPQRRAEALDIRVLAGSADEPADRLGLAHLVAQTLDKGTAQHDGHGLNDAFDEIGAVTNHWCGREMSGFSALCLPEFFARTVELHAEFLRTPTFPADSCAVALELARQELLTLEDDAQALADKLIARQAYGPVLGRHTVGEAETLANIDVADFRRFWESYYGAGRMLVSVAGPLEPQSVAETVEGHFAGFGSAAPAARATRPIEFAATTRHYQKDTEQEQIAIALPGVAVAHANQPVERVLLGVLSGGMSARLFTEVREKQGLVYWVGAWRENPRGAGMIFVGASTTPQRCDKTYATLLRELARVGEDVNEEEIRRALAGICVRADLRGDMTRARCSEQADDVLHYGRPVDWEEKRAQLEAVTVDDVKRYCATYVTHAPRSVVTLGPRALGNGEA